MDGYEFPPISEKDLASTHAVEAMKTALLNSEEPVTIIIHSHRSINEYSHTPFNLSRSNKTY